MRKIIAGVTFLTGLCVSYAVWPLWTAWSIRDAIRTGNSAYLETAVDWPSVKETLKPSLVAMALGPGGGNGAAAGFWESVKSYAGARAADALVERIVTPEGLPVLFSYGKAYRERIKGQLDEEASLPWHERARRSWGRLKRAAFTGAARFEFLVADRFTPARHYDGTLELKGWRWTLTELRLKMIEPPPDGAAAR